MGPRSVDNGTHRVNPPPRYCGCFLLPLAALGPQGLAMKVLVHVREQPIEIEVGPGNQRLKWLAMVAVQRFESDTGHSFACAAPRI